MPDGVRVTSLPAVNRSGKVGYIGLETLLCSALPCPDLFCPSLWLGSAALSACLPAVGMDGWVDDWVWAKLLVLLLDSCPYTYLSVLAG